MKKIYIGVVLAIIVVVGIFTLNDKNTAEYVATVDNEVTQLENELAELDLMVADGSLTSAQATEAKIKILTRLNTINESVASSEKAKLTPAQQKQLSEGLDRLKTILINYKATLAVIDDKAVDAEVKAKVSKRGGGSHRTILAEVADTIDSVQDMTEEVVENYESDEMLDIQVDEAIAEEVANESENSETSSSSDETIEVEDNVLSPNTQPDEDESTGESDEGVGGGGETSIGMPTMDDSSTTEMEIEGEVEVAQ
ncbi:hypothetical protein H6785_00175 [Candidatus Nomurabacteria bacterium]|nr:hypothetical protein [Candidatus Nomurabacteria bacterium]